MPSVDVDVLKNEFPRLISQFAAIKSRGLRKQMFVTVKDIKENIQRHDAIDTGNMLGSVNGKMVSDNEVIVSVSAESEKGYPYPWIVNYGGRRVSPRPFFSEAEAKAFGEFPERMRREFEAAF